MQLALFGFATGLYLALLQFGMLFLLVIHVSSTYVTYAMIVLAWMLGTLIGLRWRGLDRHMALGLGLLGYYAIYGLVVSDPLAVYTLPLAGLGVVAAGLWAGRFFVVMLPFFGRADRLFFHENNGFLVGVVGAFVGFTLLGRAFLLIGPVLLGAGLLLQLLAIESRSTLGQSAREVGSS